MREAIRHSAILPRIHRLRQRTVALHGSLQKPFRGIVCPCKQEGVGHNVDWSRCEAHIWERHRLLADWAIEALADPLAIVWDPDPASTSGQSIRVVGQSVGAGCLLVVVLVRTGDRLVAASAWRANATYRRHYLQGRPR
jgi:hypothetical protein